MKKMALVGLGFAIGVGWSTYKTLKFVEKHQKICEAVSNELADWALDKVFNEKGD